MANEFHVVKNTAYSESLSLTSNNAVATTPSYVIAADTFNLANKNETFEDSVRSTVTGIPSFIATALISGANQLYNIPADVGNLFGGDFERSDTQEVISNLDSDLGEFYRNNKTGVDLAGFLVSSIIPGTAGIKLLNAGQKSLQGAIASGKFGANTGKALGLLAPNKQALIAKATQEVANNSSAASLLNRNAIKAVGSGIGQNAYEALAFETAVTATLFNSPVLENQTFGDFVSNVAWGAGIFGMVGGAIDAAKLSRGLKKTADRAAIEARPYQFIDETSGAALGYEKLALDYEQLAAIPKTTPEGIDEARKVFLQQAGKTKADTLQSKIRNSYTELAQGDVGVASTLQSALKAETVQSQQSAVIGLAEISRFGVPTKAGAQLEKIQAKVAKGKASAEELETYLTSPTNISYVRSYGEGAGLVTHEAPVITSLVDTLKKGENLVVKNNKVIAGKKTYKFNTEYNFPRSHKLGLPPAKSKPWNPLKVDTLEANARYIWAASLPKFNLAGPKAKALTIDVNDIPLMEKLVAEVTDPADLAKVKLTGLDEKESLESFLAAPSDFLGDKKIKLANDLLKAKDTHGPKVQEEIAAIVNVKSSLLSGEVLKTPVGKYNLSDILAMQSNAEAYTKKLVDQGDRSLREGLVDIWNVPHTIKLVYNSEPAALSITGAVQSTVNRVPLSGINDNVVENMVIIKEQQKLYQEGTARASAAALGKEFAKLEDITSGQVFSGAVPSGAGQGFVTAASSNYGTLAATVENIGAVTSRTIEKFKASTRDILEPALIKLSDNQEAAIEWSTLNQRVRSIEGEYALNAAGDALEPMVMVRWRKQAEELRAADPNAVIPNPPTLANPAMEASIPLLSKEVRDLVKLHIETNSTRTGKLAGLRTSQGVQFNRSPDAFYPIPVNPKDFPHFAMVTDGSITSGNHSKTLYASSAEELADMIKKVKADNPHLDVRTKAEAERYFKDEGRWDYEKTLSNNYLDVAAHRKGVSAPFIVATDPKKIVNDTLNWHLDRETGLVREAVSAKYEVQFEELRRLGDEFTNVQTSKFGASDLDKFASSTVNNPFADYIKTALAIQKSADYPWWTNVNRLADTAISKMYKKVEEVFDSSKSPEDLAGINSTLKKAGYKGAAYDESMEIFANAAPARGTLSSVVQKANSVLATVVLRWDAINAVNNAVSANVLLGAESKAIFRAIQRGDEEAVGALAKLGNMKVPGTEESIFTPSKLVANAIKKFNRNSKDMEFFRENGYITSISQQYRDAMDGLTFRAGQESVSTWSSRIDGTYATLKKAGDTGEKWTGNRLAEEFNRFVAADVMKQMTDVAVSRNLMTGKEQLAYINTFVNRTQGNYLAAQRPMMFQGPIGQSIGLFQTYQFNLLQQMFRYVGEGHSKDALTLLGLQGTIHGMNGLPAFNAVNTNLIGNASGNTEHRDAYDAVYGIAGKEAGDWLMYGLGSNALGLLHPDLKMNLYTRGDINPRHVTIVPTNPSTIPIVQASAKVMGNIFNTVKQINAGGDVSTTLLKGLEHNGISRPLAGLAQTLQGFNNPEYASYSTTNKGNVIAANDLISLANLGRIAGAKPLDEAIARDATYRYKSYALNEAKKRNVLGHAIKSTMQAGQEPSLEQIEDFALQYVRNGGRQVEFNQWFGQLYKDANLSQTNAIKNNLNSPFSQSMQTLMGDHELRDFTSQ